jgi:hypothetical protein
MRKKLSPSRLPEIVFGSSDPLVSRQISRMVRERRLRKLLPRVYTPNFADADAEIIRRNMWIILGHVFPGAIVSHRSAIEFLPSPGGCIYLTGKTRRGFKWPGLTVRMTDGPGPLDDDRPVYGSLFVSSLERACLENLSPARVVDGEKRTLEQAVLEERLLTILNTRGETGLNSLRDRAREVASQFGWQAEFDRLNQIISSILSTHPSKILTSPLAAAQAIGEPYDPHRLLLFQQLIAGLRQMSFPDRPEKTEDPEHFSLIAFFESYFSNYIEGTTFEVSEAADIIFHGKLIPNRTGDTHDVLGTYQVCNDRFEMSRIPQSEAELVEIIRERHSQIMWGRPDKNPGIFKEYSNRAGSTVFVAPEWVQGTLKRGFLMMEALSHPLARAIYMMFLISEVHPFDDGNGRLARVMMNAELVGARQSKLLIPTVYREDYVLNLKKLTRQRQANSYIKMMDRAHSYSHWLEPFDFNSLHQQLRASNAFEEGEGAALRFPTS